MTTTTVERPGARTAATHAPARKQNGTPAEEPRRPIVHAVVAAERAVRRNSLGVRLPVLGELRLPAMEDVVFIGGVALLAVVGIVEWPVALLLGLGHTLAMSRRNKVVRAFGEALEEA